MENSTKGIIIVCKFIWVCENHFCEIYNSVLSKFNLTYDVLIYVQYKLFVVFFFYFNVTISHS